MPPKGNTKSSNSKSKQSAKTSSLSPTIKIKDGKTSSAKQKKSQKSSIKPKGIATQDISKFFKNEAECSEGSEDEDDYDDNYDENDSFIDNSSQVLSQYLMKQ